MNRDKISEEFWNTLLHGTGILFSLIGLIMLLVFDWPERSMIKVASLAIYGITVILLYTCSTLLHYSAYKQLSPKIQHIFSVMDHSAIYVLIAGSYTPYIVFILNGELAIFWLVFVWVLAGLGVIYQFFFMGRFQHFSTIIYIVMGWLVVFLIQPVYTYLNTVSLILLVIGGVAFTVGTIFFSMKKVFMHTIWHVFVMVGTATMYLSILFLLAQFNG